MHSSSSSTSDQHQQQQPLPPHQGQPQAAAQTTLPAAQHWMAMQYPSAAMLMQHQMMPQHYPPPPPHYTAAFHPHHHPYMQPPPPPPLGHFNYPQHHGAASQHRSHRNNNSNNNNSNNDGAENKTLWVGDLHPWMEEQYLHSCFAPSYEIASIKIIRNRQTGLSEGYGFIEFNSHATAEKVLQAFDGMLMPKTEQSFRLNWATFNSGEKHNDNGSDLSIFVGDLAADVTDSLLHETFASKYPSVKAAKVVIDANTGRSKGYGFVRFGDDKERAQAMTEMNGIYCSTRPMRIGAATPRKSLGYQQGWYAGSGSSAQGSQSDGDLTNTTIFVGGLDPSVIDEDLRQPFAQFGEIISVKIPVGKGCGFVQFANRSSAEEALQKLSETVIGKQTVRLSWGRSPANKQMRNDYGNQWNGTFYGGPVFDGYGYAMPHPHDPTMYAAAAYGAYPMYGSQQQVN